MTATTVGTYAASLSPAARLTYDRYLTAAAALRAARAAYVASPTDASYRAWVAADRRTEAAATRHYGYAI